MDSCRYHFNWFQEDSDQHGFGDVRDKCIYLWDPTNRCICRRYLNHDHSGDLAGFVNGYGTGRNASGLEDLVREFGRANCFLENVGLPRIKCSWGRVDATMLTGFFRR